MTTPLDSIPILDDAMDPNPDPDPVLTEYTKSIQNLTLLLVISIILITLFVVSPLKEYFVVSLVGKVVCILLLAYTMHENIRISRTYKNQEGQTYHYLLSLFVFVLILSLVRKVYLSSITNAS